MKRTLTALAACLAMMPAFAQKAQKMEPWQDPDVYEENRMPMRATFTTDQQKTQSLDGVWKFAWSESLSGRVKGFEAVGYDDSSWGTIPAPGNWELNGYGDPMYLNIGYGWRGNYENNPPYAPSEHNHVGDYRRTFNVDPSWIGNQICLCIGSATSNVRVWVNGKLVGYSEDSKLEARFDITKYVKAGENLLALEIFRWCDGSYVEDQDFWRLSGISRGVWVYTREKERLEDVNIIAGMDGSFSMKAVTTSGISSIEYGIFDASGNQVASGSAPVKKQKDGTALATCSGNVSSPALWSAEEPNLYTLKVKASGKKGVAESASVAFGFRTVEIRNAQLLVNGKPVLIKGADRHEISAENGYCVTEEEMVRDIRIMKELNMNAVRTCHYPDNPIWLSLCDKYGIYVVDEGNIESHGMGYGDETLAKDPAFLKTHLIRDQRMVLRDINHPSVIVWSMGNEAGNGDNFRECYKWIKGYDPTRPVQYERGIGDFDTDIMCPMYADPDWCEEYCQGNPDKPLIQCEYAHAMGNSMGNFKDYWDIVRKYPSYQGGFIWDFVDQALRWPSDEGGTDHIFAYGGDFNKFDPSDGPFNCNGVIAADRTLHPHAYEVRYQYRNILTSSSDPASGKVDVYNEFFFRDLSRYRLCWTLMEDGEPVKSGVVENLNVAPGQTAKLDLGIGEMPQTDGDIFLNVSYVLKVADGLLPAGTEMAYDQLTVKEGTKPVFVAGSAKVGDNGTSYSFENGQHVLSGIFSLPDDFSRVAQWQLAFDLKTGALSSYKVNGNEMVSEPLLPEFGRALTENDMGAHFDKKMNAWRYLTFKVKSMTVNASGDVCKVDVEYEPVADGAAIVLMHYDIYADGTVCGVESMKDAGKLSEAPDLFRFGMKMTMPGQYSALDFYGRGPWENYVDRNSSAMVGRYRQSVNEQYHYGYVRPQESGTKTDLRFFRVLDEGGNGLEISSPVKFSASALPFSIAQLDCMQNGEMPDKADNNTIHGENRHSLNLKAAAHENDRVNGKTYIDFDLIQMGLGSVNSWGAIPLDKYLVMASERTFQFQIRPVGCGKAMPSASSDKRWSGLMGKYSKDASVNQLLLVKCTGGSNADAEFYVKKDGGWNLEGSCKAFIGRNGLGKVREGDGKTPEGEYGIRRAFGIKPDPGTKMPYVNVIETTYACGEEGKYYNQIVDSNEIGFVPEGEHMIKIDPNYNYGLETRYNDANVYPAGSSIFVHCKGPKASTAGCVALDEDLMKKVIEESDLGLMVCIHRAE